MSYLQEPNKLTSERYKTITARARQFGKSKKIFSEMILTLDITDYAKREIIKAIYEY